MFIKVIRFVFSWVITFMKLREIPSGRRVSFKAIVRGTVCVGKYTYIGAYSEIRGILSEVSIGNYCSIGRNVKIFSSGQAHRFNGLSSYPFFSLDSALDRKYFNVVGGPTIIGHDTWIGSGAIIMPSIKIGNGAVIGAGAVVTKDVPAYSIVAGVPARLVSIRFSTELAQIVEKSKWWNLSYKELRSRYPELIKQNTPLIDISQLK